MLYFSYTQFKNLVKKRTIVCDNVILVNESPFYKKTILFGSQEVFKVLESLNSVEKSCFNSHVLNYISLKIFYFFLIFYSSLEDLLIDFRGRETEGEREGEKH